MSDLGIVESLVEHDGVLFAAGTFSTIRNLGGTRVWTDQSAYWDGTQWHAMSTEQAAWQWNPGPRLFSIAGELLGIGSLNGPTGTVAIGRWNGAEWEPYAPGPKWGNLHSLVEFGGTLHAGGRDLLSDPPGVAVARWNGSAWESVGTFDGTATVENLSVHQGRLIATGDIRRDGQFPPVVEFDGIAAWDGQSWSPIPPGLERVVNWYDAVEYQDELWLLARVDEAGYGLGLHTHGGVRLVGTELRPLVPQIGLNGIVRAALEHNGELFVGGEFTGIGGIARRIAAWNGRQWRDLPGIPFNQIVHELIDHNGVPIAAAGSGVYRWNGQIWEDLIDASPGAALARFDSATSVWSHAGMLYVGGRARPAGASTASFRVGVWDGSSWELLGGEFDAAVDALCVVGNSLYAGGKIRTVGGAPALAFAQWNGSEWLTPINSLLNPSNSSWVEDMAAFEGRLMIAGQLALAGGPSANGLLEWTGEALVPIGQGVASARMVDVVDGVLYASVAANPVPGGPSIAPARFDGTLWHPIAAGTAQGAYVATRFNGELILGGSITTAGGLPSAFLARATNTAIPWIALHPIDTGVTNQAVATLTAAPATGYDFDGPLTYQWRRDGVPIANGPAGASTGGGTVSGASGTLSGDQIATLTIDAVAFSDAGSYDIVIANACGSATSNPAMLVVTPGACPPDLTGTALLGAPGYGQPNGILNTDDFFYYLAQYAAGNLAVADLTTTNTPGQPGYGVPNGVITSDDFFYYLDAFAGGC
ncbi:MAG: immunoglobulin domain-containing protein [Phycisphaerales bacterium]